MTSDLIEVARHTRDDMLGNFDGEHDHWAELLSKLIAEIDRLATLSQPQHGGLVEAAIDQLSGIASPSAGVLRVEQAEALTLLIETVRATLASNSPVVMEE